MKIKVKDANGNIQPLNLPDGMSQEEMEAAIEQLYPKGQHNIKPDNATPQNQGVTGDTSPERPDWRKGYGNIGQDVVNSVMNTPSAAWDFMKNIYPETKGAVKQIATEPGRAGANFASGALGLPNTIFNIPGNVVDYFSRKGGIKNAPNLHNLGLRPSPTSEEIMGILGQQGQKPGDALIRAASTFALPGGALRTLGAPGFAADVATNAAIATGENQDPLQATLLPAGLHGAGRLAELGADRARNLAPSRMFRGHLTPEELMANQRAAQGTETPLGDVVDNPFLKFTLENTAAHVPFSGVHSRLHALGRDIRSQANNIVESLRPTRYNEETGQHEAVSGDMHALAHNLLEGGHEEEKARKNALWSAVNQGQEAEGLRLDLSGFTRSAFRDLDSLSRSPLFSFNDDFKRLFNKILSLGSVDPSGAPYHPTIGDAHFLASLFDKMARTHLRDPASDSQFLGKKMEGLARDLRSDVRTSVEKSGSPELNTEYRRAKEHYSETYAPYLENELHQYISGKKSAQSMISDLIQPSTTHDRYEHIASLIDVLPNEMKGVPGFTYLRRAFNKEHQVNPRKLANLIDALGERQFQTLFPDPGVQQRLLDYVRLKKMNAEALDVMRNPKTGQRTTQSIVGLALGGGAHIAGGPLTGLGSLAASGVAANLFRRAMMSERVRNSLVNKMLRNDWNDRFRGTPLEQSTPTQQAFQRFGELLRAGGRGVRQASAPLELELNRYKGQENDNG